jgi:hypothetical protein
MRPSDSLPANDELPDERASCIKLRIYFTSARAATTPPALRKLDSPPRLLCNASAVVAPLPAAFRAKAPILQIFRASPTNHGRSYRKCCAEESLRTYTNAISQDRLLYMCPLPSRSWKLPARSHASLLNKVHFNVASLVLRTALDPIFCTKHAISPQLAWVILPDLCSSPLPAKCVATRCPL